MSNYKYTECIDSISPSKAEIAWPNQHATVDYYVEREDGEPLTINDYPLIAADVIGETNTSVSATGALNRTMPLAHPIYSWMFATAVTNFQPFMTQEDAGEAEQALPGVTGGFTLENSDDSLEVQAVAQVAVFPNCKITINFQNLPYPLCQDYNIATGPGTYYTPSGGTASYTYAYEWWRYCTYYPTPKEDVITFKQGSLKFVGQATSTTVKNPVNKATFPGQPSFLLPNQLITIRWEKVPYRYISSANSYIRSYRGRVNQFAFWDWLPGELLYMGYKPTPYTIPVPSVMPWPTEFGTTGIYTAEKLVDIEFLFLETRRIGTNLPTPNFPPPGTGVWSEWNYNWIIGGHNLLPWQDRNFYYVTNYMQASGTPVANSITVTLSAGNVLQLGPPFYLSFPVELLWLDPDSPVAMSVASAG